jgi:hypothetical protein
MQRRGISEEQVESAIRDPDATRPAHKKRRRRFEKRISAKRRLAVVVEDAPDRFIVVAVWWM